MENIKLKRFIKNLFENKDYELTFEDEITSWDYSDVIVDEYTFKYNLIVESVCTYKNNVTVGFIKVIINDIIKEGDDYYHNWKKEGYKDYPWYIQKFESSLYEETLKLIPIDFHLTFYGFDEK